MSKSRLLAVFLTALMVLSVLGAAPVAAQPQWSASGGSASANPGDTVQVTFSVANNGDETGSAEVTVQNGTLPSSWSVTSLSANDPNPQDQFAVIRNPPTYVFSDVDPGETVTVTATVDVPGGAADGSYTLDATVNNASNGNQIATPSSTIQVSSQNGQTPTPTTPTPTPPPGDGDLSIERVNVIDGSGVAGGAVTVHNAADSANDDLVEVRFNDTVTSVGQSGWKVEFEDGSMEEADSVDLNGNGPSVTLVFDGGFDDGDAFNVTDVHLNGASVNGNSMNTDEEVDAVATAGAAENNANKSVWIGETSAIITDSTNEDLYIQRGDGTFVSSPGTADNNQIFIFNSDGRSAGEYHVDFDSEERKWNAGGDEVVLKLRDLGLSIEADDRSIDVDTDAEAEVSANTGGRTLRLGVRDEDGDFVSGKNMTEMLDPSTEETFNFGQIEDDGNYTYYVEDLTTGITASSEEVEVADVDVDASFAQSSFVEHRGDVMNITVELTDTDVATIALGTYDETGYGFNATVEDDDGDDQVTLQWNTFLVDAADGNNSPDSGQELSVADDDDNLLNVNDTKSDVGGPMADDVIQATTYDLSVRTGADETAEADDVATASLQQRSTNDLVTWTAPESVLDDISDKGDVYERVGINITQDSSIAEGDLLITQISASGLEGALKDEASDATPAFKGLSGQVTGNQYDNPFSLSLNQTNAQANRNPLEADFTNAHDNNADSVMLVPDYKNDTYFAVWDVSEVEFERSNKNSGNISDGDQFNANFTLFSYQESSTEYGLAGPNADDQTVEAGWSFVDAEIDINLDRGDIVRVRAQPNQSVSGTATMATGTELDVRIQTRQGETNAFLLGPNDVTVENGTWSTMFDFTNRVPGTELEVEVSGDEVADDVEEDGIVMGPPQVHQLTFQDQNSGGDSVVVQRANLSDGGFVAIHLGSASGEVIGTTRYIEPGESARNLGVGLSQTVDDGTTLVAMPHLDTNSNERFEFPQADGPYTRNGSPVTQSATISVPSQQTPRPTPTPRVVTATPPPTPTPQVVTRTVMVTPTPGQQGPGFGVVVALIALVAAALLAVRRHN